MINNEVRDTEGRVIGFRCSVCDGVKTKMWDTICNECRAKYSAGKPEEQPEPNLSTQGPGRTWWIYPHTTDSASAHVLLNKPANPDFIQVREVYASETKGADSVSDGGSEPATSVSSPESAAVSLSAGVKEQEEWTNLGAIVCLGSTALFGCESEDHAKGATSAHNSSVAALRERITQLEKAINNAVMALETSNDLGPTLGDGVVSWPLGAEIRHRLNKALEEKDAKDQR